MPAKRSTKARTSSRTRTSSQNRRTQARGPQKGNKKNTKKKQDNTKLFIGIGVGVFFFLFIIIAAVSGGDTSTKRSSGGLTEDFLSVSQRKEIYSAYNREYDALEQEARDKLANLSMEDRRRVGRTIQKKKGNLQAYLPEKMKNKFEGKYKGITTQYIQKYVIEAGDAGKF